MTKRERVQKCLDREEHDRVPGSFWHHFPEGKWFSDAAVKAHLDFYRAANLDFMKIMEEIRCSFDITSPNDWTHYIPPRRDAPEKKAQLEIIKRISDEIGDECMVFTTVFDPLRTVGIVMGYELIEAHIRENRAAVSTAFMAMAESISEYAADCISAGADGIFFSSKGAEKGRFNAEDFEGAVLSPDSFICKAIYERSKYTLLHICGYDTELAFYRNFPAAAVNWDCHHGGYDLKSGAELFGDRVILGGMQNRDGVLVDGTDEEIEAAITRIAADRAFVNRFILGADCTLPEEVNYSRVRVAMERLARL